MTPTTIAAAAAGIAFAALGAFAGLQTVKLADARAKVAAEQKGRSDDRAAMQQAAREQMAKDAQDRADQVERQRKAIEDAAAQTEQARADAGRLAASVGVFQRTIAALTAASRGAPAASAPVESGAADKLGHALSECASRYSAVAAVADDAIIRGNACSTSYDALTR